MYAPTFEVVASIVFLARLGAWLRFRMQVSNHSAYGDVIHVRRRTVTDPMATRQACGALC